MRGAKTLWPAAGVAATTLLCIAGACRPPSAPSGYITLTGLVQTMRSEVADFTLRLTTAPPAVRAKGDTIACITTEDTEIYLNDRAMSLEVVRPGDTVELVGYIEPENPRGLRFVVTFAFIKRDEPAPPDPLEADDLKQAKP